MRAAFASSPSLYQINTRVWLRHFDTPTHQATLHDIPSDYWDDLANRGIHFVWLMGVWEIAESAVAAYCFTEDLKRAYTAALPDWTPQDIIGSPYAIGRYEVSSSLGGNKALSALRTQLHQRGMRLILDFVPNHFSAHSPLLGDFPEAFVQGRPQDLQDEPDLFYQPPHLPEAVFAHGRDPYFPPWQDTAQVNYASPAAHHLMIEQLLRVQSLCDGVRCDMAMLCLRDVFRRVWGEKVSLQDMPQGEFWHEAIQETRKEQPGFVFLAEAYWGLEPQLLAQGFDYTYDKALLDALKHQDIRQLKQITSRPQQDVQRGVHFLENHDEARTATTFTPSSAQTAALLAYTLPGMRFFHDGQWEGKRIHLPVQLGRAPYEAPDPVVMAFYEGLRHLLLDPIYQQGTWHPLQVSPPAPHSDHHTSLLTWVWSHHTQRRLIVINFSQHTSSGRVFLEGWSKAPNLTLEDTLHNTPYTRSTQDLQKDGLYVFLEPFQSHLFAWDAGTSPPSPNTSPPEST
ncbi:MAG: glycosidase [Myxococcales bacterium]|nr:glycosidase [Myxococcales bacterium]